MSKRHGHSADGKTSREYHSWRSMRSRCENENDPAYARYGGRGICVCNRWLEFTNFLEDMGERPEGLTLDRIDSDGDYELGNCRWATWKEQERNRRNNRMIEFSGETMCLSAWAEEVGIKECTISKRIDRWGWSIEKALTTLVRGHEIEEGGEE